MFLECTKQQSVCGSGRATVTAWEVSILGNSRPLAVEQQTKGIVVRFFFKCHSRLSKGIQILWL